MIEYRCLEAERVRRASTAENAQNSEESFVLLHIVESSSWGSFIGLSLVRETSAFIWVTARKKAKHKMACGSCYLNSLTLKLAAWAAVHSRASLLAYLVSWGWSVYVLSSHPQSGLVSSGLSSYPSQVVSQGCVWMISTLVLESKGLGKGVSSGALGDWVSDLPLREARLGQAGP